MKEHSIFIAAMEIADLKERADYLNRVCAGDLALRKQVDSLIAAHERSGEFLNEPALKQMAGAKSGDVTSAEHGAGEAEIDLSFLEPSDVTGTLGRLKHYEVREVIGRGAFGIVLKAFDEKLERIVAIKVMAPELAVTSPARKRFLREARATAAIRHENVVSIFSVEELPLPFLVMEYIDGGTLQQKLDRTGPLDTDEVTRIGLQIAGGLAAAHAKRLIHRDIKPANILLDGSTEQVKITDFGLARSVDDATMTQSGLIAGTPLYMSPEQAQAHEIDERSDLFSLGSVLYVMCTGRPPFRAGSMLAVIKRVVDDQPRSIHEIIPEVPVWLVAIIAKLHAKNPKDRFATAQEVCDRMTIRPVRSRFGHWVAAATVFLLLLVGLVITEATGFTNVRDTVAGLFFDEGAQVVKVDDPTTDSVSAAKPAEGESNTDAIQRELQRRNPDFKGTIAFDQQNGKIVGCKIAGTSSLDISPLSSIPELRQLNYPALDPKRDAPVIRKMAKLETINGYSAKTFCRAYPDNKPHQGVDKLWLKTVSTLPVGARADAVVKKLKELNPNYNGRINTGIEKGRVIWLTASQSDVITDLSPIQALKHLQRVTLQAKANHGWLTDLAPLSDLHLTHLTVTGAEVTDLTPLKGMPLEELDLSGTAVVDLSPLAGLPLKSLEISGTRVNNLAALKDLSLTNLGCGYSPVSELSPLKGMPLTRLSCGHSRISDLTPLKGMPLKTLGCRMTRVASLSPLAGMPLEFLSCGHNLRISDLSPLKGMPLKELWCPRTSVKDLSPLENLPLKKLFIGGSKVSELSPLKGMSLTSLDFYSTSVADLSPLEGMRLAYLKCPDTRVSDISVLKGMPLETLWIPKMSAARLEVARGIKTLKTINGKPAPVFWKEIDRRGV